jgi:DNA-binding LacI/PurR family transcriptional regulator
MHDAGIPESDHIEVPSGFLREPGYQSAMMTFSGNPQSAPTAVFACNDLCAAGTLQALSELGISVPDEVSIVGFDDTPFSASLQPPLTTIRMPIQEMGALAVELLVNIIEDRKPTTQQHCLPVSLTLRSSTSTSPKT